MGDDETVHRMIREYKAHTQEVYGSDHSKMIFEKIRSRGRELLELEVTNGLNNAGNGMTELQKSEIRAYLLFMDLYTF